MRPARPDRRHKRRTVLALTEIPFFQTFLIDLITLLNLYARINNRNQMNLLRLHLLHKLLKCRESLCIDRKILVVLHIINVKIHHVDWQLMVPISPHNTFNILSRLIPPSALSKAKRILRRNIACADHLSKLLHHIIGALTCDDIQIQICALTGHREQILLRVSNIKTDRRRVIKKESYVLLPRHYDKVVCAVKRCLVLRVMRIICTVAHIPVPPLVDTAVCLPQSINDIRVTHLTLVTKPLLHRNLTARKGSCKRFCRNLRCHRLRLKRAAKHILFYHDKILLLCKMLF